MRRGSKDEDDEVEQLLQAAQDEMILKLSVNSHTSRSKPDYLDPDLHSRFLALRSKPSHQQQKKKKKETKDQKRRSISPPKSKGVEETPDDLMLRFAALKTTLPSSSSSVPPSVLRPSGIGDEAGELGEDDEVEKLIQWAIDAARLDPSPPSDDDDDDGRSSDNDDDNGSKRNVKP
ncbi:uncharacterized protein LOC108839885 [Raphanus sativus]|uniref:Uncharacterized protein LOC108839885 n=1 Tax=Raphanus sativus TaxID=3726 RepID=A0A6J0M872_RAPSA|nr:uncharacterized protein LOC108839885 [Raphanus sativus]